MVILLSYFISIVITAARLQTFPDDFVFSNSLTDSALQIGNAVPIDLVKASGEVFKAAIKCIKMSRAKEGKKKNAVTTK